MANQISNFARDAVFRAADRASDLGRRFGVPLLEGMGNGVIVVAENAFQRWLGQVRRFELGPEWERREDEVGAMLRRLIASEVITPVMNRHEQFECLKQHLGGTHVPKDLFKRVRGRVIEEPGRQDFKRRGAKPKRPTGPENGPNPTTSES